MKQFDILRSGCNATGAVAAFALGMSALVGCAEQPAFRAECVVTQPNLLGANSLTGPKGVLALILKEYGVSWKDYSSDRFDNKNATAKALSDALKTGKETNELGDSDVIAVCLKFDDASNLSEGGTIRPYTPPSTGFSPIKTEHIKKVHQVPDYLQEAKAKNPDAKLFVINNSYTDIAPFSR